MTLIPPPAIPAKCYMHTAERMPEVPSGKVRVFIGGGVFLGKGVEWDAYEDLYNTTFNVNARRVLADNGVLITFITDQYQNGYIPRGALTHQLLTSAGWQMVDYRVWERCKCNMHQPSLSHVGFFVRPGSSFSRMKCNTRGIDGWIDSVWKHPQIGMNGDNRWPQSLARMIVEATTDPGDAIVDCFAGTGTLLGVAADMGRRAVGYEIDPNMIPHLEKNRVVVIQEQK